MSRFWKRRVGHHKSTRERSHKRAPRRRRLRSETLETRQLLAANLFHNELLPEDVNEDGQVTAADALMVVNRMSRQTDGDAGPESRPDRGQMTDVNNDGRDTVLDALMVVNRLSRERGGPEGPIDGAGNDGDGPINERAGDRDRRDNDRDDRDSDRDDSRPTRDTESDVVLSWNDVFGEVLVDSTENQNPGYASRSQAILNLAIYDVVSIAEGGENAETFYDYDLDPGAIGNNIRTEAAVSQAAHTVLSELYPDQQERLDAALESSLSRFRRDADLSDSLALGTEVANEILAIRAGDGWDTEAEYTYTDEIGYFQPDPLNPDVPAWGPAWGEVDTFAISAPEDFRPETTPPITSEQYAESYNEVLELGSADSTIRTADQTEAGIFWAYDRVGLGTPMALFNDILQTVAVQEGNTLEENAALFAQASVAMADAGIVAWDTKFGEDFWRPVTAIHQGDTDGNDLTEGDSEWVALGAPDGGQDEIGFTPPFPTYISGHATFGAALFGSLQEFYGTDEITFDVTSEELEILLNDPELQEAYGLDLDDATRTFNSFSEAMAENGRSRVYLGIHFDFDDLVGQDVGQSVASSVSTEFTVAADDRGPGGGGNRVDGPDEDRRNNGRRNPDAVNRERGPRGGGPRAGMDGPAGDPVDDVMGLMMDIAGPPGSVSSADLDLLASDQVNQPADDDGDDEDADAGVDLLDSGNLV